MLATAPVDVRSRREELETRLRALKSERGTAIHDGKTFGGAAELAAVKAELEGLDDVEAVAVGRERKSAAERESARIEKLEADLVRLEKDRLACIANAEVSARAMASSMRDALGAAREIVVTAAKLGRSAPSSVDGNEAERRLSMRLSTLFTSITGKYASRFGVLSFNPHWLSITDDWPSGEGREMRQFLATLAPEAKPAKGRA